MSHIDAETAPSIVSMNYIETIGLTEITIPKILVGTSARLENCSVMIIIFMIVLLIILFIISISL